MNRHPDPEEFEAWRDSPVTQWVLEAFRIMAQLQRVAWIEHTWHGDGDPTRELQVELRTRADAYQAIADASHDDIVSVYEPEEE